MSRRVSYFIAALAGCWAATSTAEGQVPTSILFQSHEGSVSIDCTEEGSKQSSSFNFSTSSPSLDVAQMGTSSVACAHITLSLKSLPVALTSLLSVPVAPGVKPVLPDPMLVKSSVSVDYGFIAEDPPKNGWAQGTTSGYLLNESPASTLCDGAQAPKTLITPLPPTLSGDASMNGACPVDKLPAMLEDSDRYWWISTEWSGQLRGQRTWDPKQGIYLGYDVLATFRVRILTKLEVPALDFAPQNPHKPDLTTDQRFIAGLPTKCVGRKSGPLEIRIPISRVVGAIGGQGQLLDPQKLFQYGSLSDEARLRLPFYIRQWGPAVPFQASVTLNGELLPAASLTASNGEWVMNELKVPAQLLRYGRWNPGGVPEPAENVLSIAIDTASAEDQQNWCAAVDWAALEIRALAPLILIHGNGQGDDGAGGRFWDGAVLDTAALPRLQMPMSFTQELSDQAIVYNNAISMLTDTIQNHGDLLQKLIPDKAAEYGARHAHLVVHSKGGLDARDFLARTIPKNFGVLSLTTLSTPHHGSPAPDYSIDSRMASIPRSDDPVRVAMALEAPPNAGTFNLRVSFVEAFNATNLRALPTSLTVDGETAPVVYMSMGADANLNSNTSTWGNPSISYDETAGIPGQGNTSDLGWAYALEQVYRLIGTVVMTNVQTIPVQLSTGESIITDIVIETPTVKFQENDFAVSRESSRVFGVFTEIGGDQLKDNHSTIARPSNAKTVLDAIRQVQPLKWGK